MLKKEIKLARAVSCTGWRNDVKEILDFILVAQFGCVSIPRSL